MAILLVLGLAVVIAFGQNAVAPYSPSPGHLFITNNLEPDGNGGCSGSIETSYMPLSTDWAWRVVLEPAANCSVSPLVGSDVNQPWLGATVTGVNSNIMVMNREGVDHSYIHQTRWVDQFGDACPAGTNTTESTDSGVGSPHWETWKQYYGFINQYCNRWDNATWDVGIYDLWLTQYNIILASGERRCFYDAYENDWQVVAHECAGIPSFEFDTRDIDVEDSGHTIASLGTLDIEFHTT